ncbi:MAG: DUF4013 domain-containing protein [Halobaculum sp.]
MLDGLLGYPFRGRGGVETLLLGGGLHLLAVYLPVVPYVVVLGYLLSVLVHTGADVHAGDHGAPAFLTYPPTLQQGTRLVVGGLRAVVVTAVYLALPVAMLAVTVRGVGGLGELTATSGAVVTVGGTAALLAATVFAYPLPAALANTAHHRSLRAAFDTTLLWRAARDARYFVGWTTGVTALLLGVAVARPLESVAVGFWAMFYAEVVAAAQWGWGVSRVLRDSQRSY